MVAVSPHHALTSNNFNPNVDPNPPATAPRFCWPISFGRRNRPILSRRKCRLLGKLIGKVASQPSYSLGNHSPSLSNPFSCVRMAPSRQTIA